MKTFSIKAIALIFLLQLAGCAPEEKDDEFVPTDATLSFQLFPITYFLNIYDEIYTLHGSDNLGNSLSASNHFQTGPQITFNGEPAISVSHMQLINDYTGTSDVGVRGEFFGHINYSINKQDLRVLGFNNTVTGTTTVSATTTAIPVAALIGESGDIGTYIDDAGETITCDWRLIDGGNGRAKLIFTYITNNQNGDLLFTREESYLINQIGERTSLELVLHATSSGSTLNFSGTRN